MSLLTRARGVRNADSSALASFGENRDVDRLFATVENLYHIRDLDSLLERILYEARRFVRADAGTLYLEAKGRLFFSYVQNDTLFQDESAARRHVYASQSMIIDRTSLAGYAASSGEPVLIDDVYDILSSVSYSFNPEYDKKSNYRTRSMLIVPLLTRSQTTVGVLQLINSLDKDGNSVPFSGRDRLYIMQFAQHAAAAIERAKLNREMVLRMVELSELRDPFETGQHAKRVAAFSVELFTQWSERRSLSQGLIRQTKEALTPAAMLHDVGKVAVSDVILKKPDLLTQDERSLMRMHTIYGARLFSQPDSHWDRVAREVVLNHHERWDGKGYPGKIDNIYTEPMRLGPGKSGGEIPISARIVSIADVYDALMSKRAYKEAWGEEDVLNYFRTHSGKQFDPELVEIFLGIQPVVKSIRDRFNY